MLQQLPVGEAGQVFTPRARSGRGVEIRPRSVEFAGIELCPTRESLDLSTIVLPVGTYSIGSSGDCNIVLPSPGVAERHCTIIVGPRRTVVKAWSPLTWINDGAVVEGALRIGDRLILGPVEFRVAEASQDALALPDSEHFSQGEWGGTPSRQEFMRPAQFLPPPNRSETSERSEEVKVGAIDSRTRSHLEADLLTDVQELLDEFFQRETAFRHEMSMERAALAERWQELETQSSALEFAQSHLRQEQDRLRQLHEMQRRIEAQQAECEGIRQSLNRRQLGLSERETELSERATLLSSQSRSIRQREMELRRCESDLEKMRRELAERTDALDAQERTLDIDSRFISSRQAELEKHEASVAAQSQANLQEQERLAAERLRLQEDRQAWERTRDEQSAQLEAWESQWEARRAELDIRAQGLEDRERQVQRDLQISEQRTAELRESRLRLDALSRELDERQATLDDRQRNLDWELAELDARQHRLDALETELQLAKAQFEQRQEEATLSSATPSGQEDSAAPPSAENDSANAQLSAWQEQLERLQQALDHREILLNDEAEQIRLRAKELSLREASLTQDREELEKSRIECERIRTDLTREQTALQALQDRVASERDELTEERLSWEESRRAWEEASAQATARRNEEAANDRDLASRKLQEIREREARLAELEALAQDKQARLEEEREALLLEREQLETRRTEFADRSPAESPTEPANLATLRQSLDERQAALEELESSLAEMNAELERRRAEIDERTFRLDERQEALLMMARQLRESKNCPDVEAVEKYAMGEPMPALPAVPAPSRIRKDKGSGADDTNKFTESGQGMVSPPNDSQEESPVERSVFPDLTYSGNLLDPRRSGGHNESGNPHPSSHIPEGISGLLSTGILSADTSRKIGVPEDAVTDESRERKFSAPPDANVVDVEEPKSEEVMVSRLRSELASMFGMESRQFRLDRESTAKQPAPESLNAPSLSTSSPATAIPRRNESPREVDSLRSSSSSGSDHESLEDSVSRYMQRLLAKPVPERQDSPDEDPPQAAEPITLQPEPASIVVERIPATKTRSQRKLRPEEKDAMRKGLKSFREIALISGRIAVAKSTAYRMQIAYKYLLVTTGACWIISLGLAGAETFMAGSDYFMTMVASGIAVVMSLLLWKSRQEIYRLEHLSAEQVEAETSQEEEPPQGPKNPGGLTYV